MVWELALLFFFLPAAYRGVLHVVRGPSDSAPFGWMLIGAAVAIAIAGIGGRTGAGSWVDALGVIGVGVSGFALFVAPLLRNLARWAVATDRLRLAAVLVDVRDLLQPGMGGRDDKRMVAALRDVKEGRVEHAVDALSALRGRAPAGAATAIDERITALYLSAQRFEDAVRYAERDLLAPGSKLSPAMAVELVGARLRLGELDAAVELAERFLGAASATPELVYVLYRLHLIFLAHLGRVDAVDRLLDPKVASTVSRAARRYWAGVARHASGDVAGARAAFEEARSLAGRDRRSRALVDLGLAELDRPAPVVTPAAAALADRLAAAPPTMPLRAPGRRARVTVSLIAVNLAVGLVCGFALDGWGDLGSVIRVGASLRGAVEHGEAWRLASSVFVHVGYLHLLLNLLALWSLGRLVEGLVGASRMLAIYGVAGLAGAVASFAFGKAGVSAGASGAIFGLLGAALIELALHRNRYRREWRRSLLGALLFVTIAQLAIGFTWKIVDQWAHVGGLIAGAAAGAVLSPGWRWADSRLASRGSQLAALVVVGVFAWGAVGAVTTDYGDTLRAQGRVTHQLNGLYVDVPETWREDQGELIDADLYCVLGLGGDPPEGRDLTTRLADLDRDELRRAIDRGFSGTSRAGHALDLPTGWRGSEHLVTATDDLSNTMHYRLLTFVGETGGVPIAGVLYVPDLLARDGADELEAILRSIRTQ